MIGPYLKLCNSCFKTREMESREGRSVLEGRLEVAIKEAEQVNLTSFDLIISVIHISNNTEITNRIVSLPSI